MTVGVKCAADEKAAILEIFKVTDGEQFQINLVGDR